MKFQDIDLSFDPPYGGIPIEIKLVFQYQFQEGDFLNRYQKLSGEDYLAYTPYRDYWEFIEKWRNDKVLGEDGKPIENIREYYRAYSKGFLDGYFEFERETNELSRVFNQIDIERIYKETLITPQPFSSRGYLYTNDDPKQPPIPVLQKDLLSDQGKKIGRGYKAWFYIIKNTKPFIHLFRQYNYETYKRIEAELIKQNSHHEGYSSPLQTVIDEIERTINIGQQSKAKPQKPIRTDLQKMFEEAGKEDTWDSICSRLKEQDSDGTRYIDEGNNWVKIEQGHKKQLAGLIYYIGREFLKDSPLTKNEISTIARNTFNVDINPSTAQNGIREFSKYGWDDFF